MKSGGKRVDQAQRRRRRTADVQFRSVGKQCTRCLFEAGCREQHRLLAQRVAFERRRALHQRAPVVGPIELQTALQRLTKQVVQSQRAHRRVEHIDEQAESFDFIQQPCRVGVVGKLRTARCFQLRQHADPQQKISELRSQLVDHLSHEKVEHRAVCRTQHMLVRRRRARTSGARAAHHDADRDAHSGRPALCAIEQPIGDRLIQTRFGCQSPRVVARELQLQLPELSELITRQQACERQRWLGARRDRHAPARTQPLDQQIKKTKERRVVDAMHIFERDDAVRDLARIERVDDLRRQRALLFTRRATHARHQRLRRRAPRRIERLERRQHAFEQPLQIVAGVGRYPRHRVLRRQSRDLVRERGRLAVAGGCAQQDDAAVQQRIGQPRLHQAALDVRRARPGRLNLGAGEGHATRSRTASVSPTSL